MKALIFDIYKGTTNDGEGIRDTVFFKGCPLSCKWCHNPEGISPKNHVWHEIKTCIGCGLCENACSENAVIATEEGINIDDSCVLCGKCVLECPTKSLSFVAKEYTVLELKEEIVKDKEYFSSSNGGVTASGGEAMLNSDFLCEFFSEMKKEGINTALDTTGFCKTQKLFEVLKYTDTVLYDLKVIDPFLHKKWTGVDNGIILENIIKIAEHIKENKRLKLWIRTPVITGYTDNEEIIYGICDFIKTLPKDTVERWELCAFNNSCNHKYKKLGLNWELKDFPLISKEKMESLLTIAKESGAKEVISSGIMK